ncbi:MAG: hypothetical protein DRJ42_28520 [Deltaproteobacteria bacterium]|nr:MAG: hypothetical protein DRJ42_28520 [Deltaproteobacteria bacterium]
MFAATLLIALNLVACGDDDTSPDAGDAGTLDSSPPVDSGPPDTGPAPDDSPWKGPWVIRGNTDRATVVWESRLPVDVPTIDYEPEAGGASMTASGSSVPWDVRGTYGVGNILVDEPDPPGVFHMNSVEVTGLSPGTCYRYSIVGYAERGGRFCTMHPPEDHTTPISFFVVGDTNPILTNTARILEAGEPETTEFAVHVGDLQYYDSIFETYQNWFPLMKPLLSAGSMFPCVGNHELEIDFELEDYYSRFWENPGHDGTSIRYHFETGGVHFFSLSTEHDLLEGSEQYEWFVARIAAAEAEADYRFSIVFLHRPLYTVAYKPPLLDVRDALEPVFAERNVALVLSGHMHGYERFEVGDLTYVTTGGGGSVRGDIDEHVMDYPEDAMLRVSSGSFFESMVITIEGDALRGVTTDDLGMVRDSFEKTVVLGPRPVSP